MAFDPISQLIESTLGGLASLGSSWISSESDQKINAENLAYQREYNQQIFEREDTAVQRRVADLKAAGMSPILAAGSGAGSGGVATAPQKQQERTLDPGAAMMAALNSAQTAAQIKLIQNQAAEAEAARNLKEAEVLRTNEETAGISIDNTIRGNYGQEEAWAQVQKLRAEGNLTGGSLMDLLYNLGYYRERNLPTSAAGYLGTKAMEEAGTENYNRNWFKSKGLPTNASGKAKDMAQGMGMLEEAKNQAEAEAKRRAEEAAAEAAAAINDPKIPETTKKGLLEKAKEALHKMLTSRGMPSKKHGGVTDEAKF